MPFVAWLVIAHLFTFVLTFDTDPAAEFDPRWAPLIHPSERAVVIGRLFLVAASCNLAYWPVALRLYRSPDSFYALVAALFLISATYTAVHWALRPENIFSWKILGAVRMGLYPLVFGWWLHPILERRYARRHALPLNEWLSGLLACCEKASKGGRLVDSETPGAGEVDCLELQVHLNTELESRACLTQHRKKLSQDGFREIRRLVRSVDALDHRAPDQEKWQQVVRDARTVLAMRDKLRS